MVPMVVYALLGGSRTLSVSTTSTVAVLTGSTLLAANVAADSGDPARDLAMLTLLVGVILVGARLLHLGALVDNISEATLTGIKIGVGLTVAAGQLPKLLGIEGDPTATAFFAELRGVFDDLGDTSWTTVALSVATHRLLLGLSRLLPEVPAPLVAVVFGIVLVAIWSIDEHGVAVIAPIPSGLPVPIVPSLDHIGAAARRRLRDRRHVLPRDGVRRRGGAAAHEPPIDNDQELAANGMSCLLGPVFRAMPSAGGFSQTAINQRSGARTQLSELVTAVLAVACALFLGGVLSDLPEATLGCMVVVAVIGLVRAVRAAPVLAARPDRVLGGGRHGRRGLVLGLLAAVLVGVVLTLFLVLRELDRVGVTELQPTTSGDDVHVAGPETEAVPGLLVLRLDGALYTANVRGATAGSSPPSTRSGPSTLVLDVSALDVVPVTVIDQLRRPRGRARRPRRHALARRPAAASLEVARLRCHGGRDRDGRAPVPHGACRRPCLGDENVNAVADPTPDRPCHGGTTMAIDTYVVLAGVYDVGTPPRRTTRPSRTCTPRPDCSTPTTRRSIARRDDGKVKITKKHETPTRVGGVLGGGLGLATGLVVVLFPFAAIGGGLLLGTTAGGALLGAVTGHAAAGMSRHDLKELGEQLDKGQAGLVVVGVADVGGAHRGDGEGGQDREEQLKADNDAIEADAKSES